MARQLSIRSKVLITLGLTFAIVVSATTTFTFLSERDLVRDVSLRKAEDTAYAYFDGINTMMLTGTFDQRNTLREKLMQSEDIVDIRMLRGEAVSRFFGPGLDHERAADDIDRRALRGERILLDSVIDGGRAVTLVKPILASKNYRGTDCLTCHVVPENTQLGAVRVTYSLKSIDARITDNLLKSAVINAALFGLGIAVLVGLLRTLVFKRLQRMRDTMQHIAANADLSRRVDSGADDELGSLAGALNGMLQRFADGMHRVASTTHQLSAAAASIAGVAEQTSQGASSQRNQTDSMVTAMQELEATAQEIKRTAAGTAEASNSADSSAHEGADLTGGAISGIQQLVEELQRAEDVISQLDKRSHNVGSVLDVIKGIAEQTNLLALNAAIEAARAGEKGRGFAVVADEVRTLATRSHDSTQEIEQIIEQLQVEARDAVSVMEEARRSAERRSGQIASTADSLSDIAAQVSAISQSNTVMAQAADEQSMVTAEVNRNVATISQISDQTAREAEQTAHFSEQLVGLAKELEQMLNQYRLSGSEK